jgi:hypothetical protein
LSLVCLGFSAAQFLTLLLTGLELIVWAVAQSGREVLVLALVHGYQSGKLYMLYYVPLVLWSVGLMVGEGVPDHFVFTFSAFNVIAHSIALTHIVIPQSIGHDTVVETWVYAVTIASSLWIQTWFLFIKFRDYHPIQTSIDDIADLI